ncbi:MAG TPA: 4Fe-4S binding protein [Clostridiales bacterium]|nr:4Fe-4S binding protein [Clostridiales bacterium]
MGEKYAVRNLRLCTKDCLCLYVCPTGATDTENSVIDVEKCIGCGDCADACPSAAISMVPKVYPDQQVKDEAVIIALRKLVRSKGKQELIAKGLDGRLAKAFARSNSIMAEDLIREAGYMLPQSDNGLAFLKGLTQDSDLDESVKEMAQKLIEKLNPGGGKATKKYRCQMCGYLHEGELTEDFTCPNCFQPASVFV